MRKKKVTKQDKVILLDILKRGEITSADMERLNPKGHLFDTNFEANCFFWGTALTFLTLIANDTEFLSCPHHHEAPRFTMGEAIDKFDAKIREYLLRQHPDKFPDGKVVFPGDIERELKSFRLDID